MRIEEEHTPIEPIERTPEIEEEQSVKKTLAGEKKKLSKMTGKEKAAYIYSYYKFHILVILAVIVFAGSTIYHQATKKDEVLAIAVVNDAQINTEGLIADYSAEVNLTEKQEITLYDELSLEDLTESTSSAGMGENPFYIRLAAHEVDLAICDQAGKDYIEGLEAGADPVDFLTDTNYSLWADRIDGCGINITGTAVADYLGTHNDPAYLCLTNLTGHDEELLSMINFLLNKGL